MENQETFWMVWREGDRREPTNKMGRNPTVKHEIYASADDEANRLAKAYPGETFHVLQWISRCRVEPDPIKRVWEKWKHMDRLLSDNRWFGEGNGLQECRYDFWQAIKESQEGKKGDL